VSQQQQEPWRDLISSGLKGDLVVLFRKNPGIIDTVEGIARRLGVTPDAIQSETTELLGLGFLKKKRFADEDVFFLDEKRDKEIQESATRFLALKIQGKVPSP
jgi:hypothetical protein